MQQKPKSNSLITSTYDEEMNTLIFNVLGVGEIKLDLNRVHTNNINRAAIHGFNQRIPDSAAIPKRDKNERLIPERERTQMKFERMKDLRDFYESGTPEWSRVSEGGGGGGKSITLEAIARWRNCTYEEAQARVEQHAEMHKMDMKAALAFFRTGAKTKNAIQEIRDERALSRVPEGLDADAMLEEIPNEE